MSRRFAIYYAPPAGSALETFGRAWLGRDHATGETVAQPQIEGFSPERLAEITRSPRHYGFHATLKAPFALPDGAALEDLHQGAQTFAAGHRPFRGPPLEVSALSGFIALTPAAPAPELERLAAACVQHFDDLRAPLAEEEIARRRESGLSARQDAYLLRYGYPYVLEEFRFHITLTGRLDEPERGRVLAILRARAEAVAGAPLILDAISIYEQADRARPFRLSARYPLGETA